MKITRRAFSLLPLACLKVKAMDTLKTWKDGDIWCISGFRNKIPDAIYTSLYSVSGTLVMNDFRIPEGNSFEIRIYAPDACVCISKILYEEE